MIRSVLLAVMFLVTTTLSAQPDRWQQKVKYLMDINMDVSTNRFTGKQKLEYTNNSPDTLKKIFYHLYFNAFQPNSMMDTRSRKAGNTVLGKGRDGKDISDWDPRVRDRILNLKPDEIGYQKIGSLTMNGVPQDFTVDETILEVRLKKPILPKTTVVLQMEFEAQVPLQVRRSGRDNPATGVKYSMSQWYPKLCEYDYEGWHPTPYIAREFYGVWGDYDVKITIDKNYILGGTGYLQNAAHIGYGYEDAGVKVNRSAGEKLTWHFIAPSVHDFVWAADAEYRHISRKTSKGVTIHVLYNRDTSLMEQQFTNLPAAEKAGYGNDFGKFAAALDERWQKIADAAVIVMPFIEKNFGEYPYKQYSFIHGGDGGMEYPMATLISNPGLGTAFHELMHSWYQGVLGTNESLYPWMDEGFASFADTRVMDFYTESTSEKPQPSAQGTGPRKLLIADSLMRLNPHQSAYNSYFGLVANGLEEPMTTHADHYKTNYAYSVAAYSKGEVFLQQLGYITGAQVRDKILLEYYRLWRFKHPNANDFIRVAENVSGIKLDWYREYWVNTTGVIDYGIDSIWEENGKTSIRLKNNGDIPMPVDLQLKFRNGSMELHYIPMNLMYQEKPVEYPQVPRSTHEAWKWTQQTYTVVINRKAGDLASIVIDPSERMADVNRKNNIKEF